MKGDFTQNALRSGTKHCVGSLHSFLKCLRLFELRLGFTVPNLEQIIRNDWRRLPEADLRPLQHRILNSAILRETALPEIRKDPNML